MAILELKNNVWTYEKTVNGITTSDDILKTAGTFLDRDIRISVKTLPAPNATISRNGNTVSWTGGLIEAGSSTGATTSINITNNQISWGTGWITGGSNDLATTLRTAGAGSATLTVGAGDSASASNPSLELSASTPTSGVYYTLTAKGKGSVSTGTGWITEGSTESNEKTTYGYIKKSVYGSTISGSIPSADKNRVEIQPYGYLMIPKGYIANDLYVFANKANTSGEATAASNYSLAISGIAGTSTVTIDEDNYNSTNNFYPVIASNLNATGTLTAGIAGWFSSGEATDEDVDNATVGVIQKATFIEEGGNLKVATAGYIPANEIIGHGGTATYHSNIALTTGSAYPQLVITDGYTTTNRIQKVKLVAGQQFEIEVPNGSATDTITFTFTVDVDNNVYVE